MTSTKGKRLLALALVMALVAALLPLSSAVAAEGTALTVVDQRTGRTTELALTDLQAIAAQEGNQTYNYSGYNTFPSWRTTLGAQGPTLAGILATAGIDVSGIHPNAIFTFEASDGYRVNLTCNDVLGETRYYFPNGNQGTARGAYNPAAEAGKVAVPTALNLGKDGGTLCFGQVSPNEQNANSFVQSMANGGSITVTTRSAAQWTAVTQTTPANYAQVQVGDTISFTLPTTNGGARVYYTTDGSTPTLKSTMYNYQADNWGGNKNLPVIAQAGRTDIKVLVASLGGLPSEVTTFSFATFLLGDVNGDGDVTSIDALFALQIAVGSLVPTPAQRQAADIIGDGNIVVFDALRILRLSLQ